MPSSQEGDRLLDLVRVMARLRAPDGCPWDREQTHASLARHLLEETHEVLDAIDADDRERLREELGDVLLQVVFHAQLAADDGAWDVDDVAQGIVEKLIRRHPHVFGDVEVAGADEVLVNWERIKAEEKGEQAARGRHPRDPARARARVEGAAPGGGLGVRVAFGRLGDRGAEGRGRRARVAHGRGQRRGGDRRRAVRDGRGRAQARRRPRERAPPDDPRVRRTLRAVQRAARRSAASSSTTCPEDEVRALFRSARS